MPGLLSALLNWLEIVGRPIDCHTAELFGSVGLGRVRFSLSLTNASVQSSQVFGLKSLRWICRWC